MSHTPEDLQLHRIFTEFGNELVGVDLHYADLKQRLANILETRRAVRFSFLKPTDAPASHDKSKRPPHHEMRNPSDLADAVVEDYKKKFGERYRFILSVISDDNSKNPERRQAVAIPYVGKASDEAYRLEKVPYLAMLNLSPDQATNAVHTMREERNIDAIRVASWTDIDQLSTAIALVPFARSSNQFIDELMSRRRINKEKIGERELIELLITSGANRYPNLPCDILLEAAPFKLNQQGLAVETGTGRYASVVFDDRRYKKTEELN